MVFFGTRTRDLWSFVERAAFFDANSHNGFSKTVCLGGFSVFSHLFEIHSRFSGPSSECESPCKVNRKKERDEIKQKNIQCQNYRLRCVVHYIVWLAQTVLIFFHMILIEINMHSILACNSARMYLCWQFHFTPSKVVDFYLI